MIRRQYFRDMEAVAQGLDPKGVLREPASAGGIPLPCGDAHEFFAKGLPRVAYEAHPRWGRLLRHFPFHAGQRRRCAAPARLLPALP